MTKWGASTRGLVKTRTKLPLEWRQRLFFTAPSFITLPRRFATTFWKPHVYVTPVAPEENSNVYHVAMILQCNETQVNLKSRFRTARFAWTKNNRVGASDRELVKTRTKTSLTTAYILHCTIIHCSYCMISAYLLDTTHVDSTSDTRWKW